MPNRWEKMVQTGWWLEVLYSALNIDPKLSSQSTNRPRKDSQQTHDVLFCNSALLDGKTLRFEEVVSSIILYIYNIRHVMSSFLRLVLSLLVVVIIVSAYDKIDGYNELMHYYEENSQFPILHIYHNRHFSKSRQFEDFLEVWEETEYRNIDVARFVMTDCEKLKGSV